MGNEVRSGSKGGRLNAKKAATAIEVLRSMPPGEMIDVAGEYEFRGPLREGGLSFVIRVLHQGSNEAQALKLMRPELVGAEPLRKAFSLSAARAGAIGGGQALRVLKSGQLEMRGEVPATWWFIATSWVDGRSLRELLTANRQAQRMMLTRWIETDPGVEMGAPPRQGLMTEQAFELAVQCTQALAELHRVGIAHLDVKLEHFLLTKKNAVRLIDCATSPALRQKAEESCGAPWTVSRYAPPELARGEWDRLGPATDVYQLALAVYEMFAGEPCLPWVGYEELCETTEFVPPAFDELIRDSLSGPDQRPVDANQFLGRLRRAEKEYQENVKRGRRRPARKAKEIWTSAAQLSEQSSAPWSFIAGTCQRLLEAKPHLLPFGKIPARQVQDLLQQAQGKLRAARRQHLEHLVAGHRWTAATAFVDALGGEIAAAELGELRLALEMAQLAAMRKDPKGRGAVLGRVVELLKDPNLSPSQRAGAAQLLEGLSPAIEPVPAAGFPVFTDVGKVPPVQRWRVVVGEDTTSIRVVVGPALRMGRGSWDEFGNHIDLRPTKREVAESSVTVALAQTLSRAGHIELRAGPEGLEAFCMGTHGANVDGAALKRGESARLAAESGKCALAQGAASFKYLALRGESGDIVAVDLVFGGGVGAGRRAIWVLAELPLALVHPQGTACGVARPTADGWVVETYVKGMELGDHAVAPGRAVPWRDDEILYLPGDGRVMRG